MEANSNFPETSLQKSFFLSIGKHNFTPNKEWANRLNSPKTGLSLGYTDFGNPEEIGYTFSALTFIEFSLRKNKKRDLNFHVGIGSSYSTVQYDLEKNPFNRAITTKINWSFRSFFYYDIFNSKNIDWKMGLGYLHHSNGHTNLPNQGINSFAVSLSTNINNKSISEFEYKEPNLISKSQSYFAFNTGIGENVLSIEFNKKKEVYVTSFEMGKIINNTFKFGGGVYYRLYEHYYDYIKNNGTLVEEKYPVFKDNPWGYATNIGLFASSELLLDHIGFELNIGLNIYKPFYKIEREINGIYYKNGITPIVTEEELNWYYELKRTISGRIGLKYYLWSTNKAPKHNLYLGAHLNSNLGQADFTELSLGYVRRFKLKEK